MRKLDTLLGLLFGSGSQGGGNIKMQFSTAILVISLSVVAVMAEFICQTDLDNLGGCCPSFEVDYHTVDQNCEKIYIPLHSYPNLTDTFQAR